MKQTLRILSAVLVASCTAFGAARAQEPPTPKFRNAYYDCRRAAHLQEGMPAGAIVFLGNSITEQGWWEFLLPGLKVVNRGIGGDNTYGMLDRLPEILDFAPRKIFLMAGINDLSTGYPVADVADNIAAMLDLIRERVPACEVYVQSVLTPNDSVLAYEYIKGKRELVRELNAQLRMLCAARGVTYVDVAPLLSDAEGQVRTALTKDGIHLHPAAYRLWVDHLKRNKYLK